MKIRIFLTALFCGVLLAWTMQPQNVEAKELGIGSQAPSLDIEHWIQDGNGHFKPVKDFEEGKTYVVEFWATWCGPCILSMPHLAELQEKYRERDVQIISVSDETVDEVKQLLGQQNEKEGKSFDEITSAYSLTTDPDRSVYVDYMKAANLQGIPTSFIVGKSGQIEWIGHPMDMDKPLEAVVTDSWDREAFRVEMEAQQKFEEALEKVSTLANRGKFQKALDVIDEQLKAAKADARRTKHWTSVRYGVKLAGGMVDEEVLTYYSAKLKEMKGNPQAITRLAHSLYETAQEGSDISKLAEPVLAAMKTEMTEVEGRGKVIMLNTTALLESVSGKLDDAIKSQQAAIDATEDERQKKRLTDVLEELKNKANPTKDDE